jgi:post-segregation antitoxin (ccd killing protein)
MSWALSSLKMKSAFTLRVAVVLLAATVLCGEVAAEELQFPKTVEAGSAFSIPTTGSGKATLYIIGPGEALRREVQQGQNIVFDHGDLSNAGHYTAFLVGSSSTETADFDVIPAAQPSSISFLAKPSRLAVDLPNGISGVVYVFDVFRNLILQPEQVSFQLSETASTAETRKVETHNGVAWLKINSAPRSGPAQFDAMAGSVTDKRVIEQVPGDPCNLRMNARRSGDRIALETDPVRDCSGNPVPDGTIVTFIEKYNGSESTVDAPLKRGVARTDLPAHDGAVITVAAGVVLGNEIHWQGGN